MAQITDKQIARLESLLVGLQEFVDSVRGQDVQLPPEIAERIENFRADGLCLYCGLKLEGKVSRGCHATCYGLLNQRINRGQITRAQVIAKGWMDPRTEPSGRKPKRPDPMREGSQFAKHSEQEEQEAMAEGAEKHVPAEGAGKKGRKAKK